MSVKRDNLKKTQVQKTKDMKTRGAISLVPLSKAQHKNQSTKAQHKKIFN